MVQNLKILSKNDSENLIDKIRQRASATKLSLGTTDIVKDLSTPDSFKSLFGDLSSHRFTDPLNAVGLNLNSLDGLPATISTTLNVSQNPFKTLEGITNKLTSKPEAKKIIELYAEDCENLESLKGLENLIFESTEDSSIFLYFRDNPKLHDISALTPELVAKIDKLFFHDQSSFLSNQISIEDMVYACHLKRKEAGNFNFLFSHFFKYDLERFYSILLKVEFNREKFSNVIKLIRS